MWRFAVLAGLSILLFAATGSAGSLTGEYASNAESGTISLAIEEDGENLVTGTLVMAGRSWDVAGVRDGSAALGEIYPSGDDDAPARFLFRAEPDGGQLHFTLVELTPDGEAPETRRDLLLVRKGGAVAPPPESGQPAGPLSGTGSGAGFSGTWSGDILGTATALTLTEEKGALTGKADAGGYVYTLSGSVAKGSASGTFSDPAAGGSYEFELARDGDGLLLTLLVPDPASGGTRRVPLEFRTGSPGAATARESKGSPPGEADVERDPAIVGRWFWTESHVSGDFSMVLQKTLLIYPDGRFVMGDGRLAGGGDAGSFDGGGGEIEAAGEWKTQGGIVHVRDRGTVPWSPYARYHAEGNSLMFTFGDGSRRIWSRN